MNILSRQILARENLTRRCYVARTLIAQRIDSMGWLLPACCGSTTTRLRTARSIAAIRSIEAEWTKRYWEAYYGSLGVDLSRREAHPVNEALDAGSKFLSGILLRWVLFHKLSPVHGFMHEPTTYISLVYDLMEPYRVWIERAVADVSRPGAETDQLVAATIKRLKEMLEEDVYLPAFHEQTRRKNLLHAAVLALRSYLAGETPRFVVPVEGKKSGGRPVKSAFAIPGAKR